MQEGRFVLKSPFKPQGDQPQAIEALAQGVQSGMPCQVLLGVTGSGKTYTMASVIERVQRPTLVIAHNKTLAAQLCAEFREFFPGQRGRVLSSPITIITSRRRISPPPIPISKRIPPSTRRSSACATARRRRCASGGM